MHKNLEGVGTNIYSWEKKDIHLEISELEQLSEALLDRLNKVWIEFESLFILLKESIKTRTYKILFNHKYRDLTQEQLQVLKEVESIKKKVDFLMVDVRGMIGSQAKDILLRTDSIEISQNPLNVGSMLNSIVFY